MARTWLNNAGWLTFSYASRLVLGFFLGAWLTRSLGVASSGLLGTVVSAGVILGFVAEFGLRQVLVKELAARPEERDVIFGTGVRLLALSGAGAYALGSVVLLVLAGREGLLFGAILLSPLLFNAHVALLSRWDAIHESRRGAKLAIVANLVSSAAKAGCILGGWGMIGASVAIAGESVLIGLLALSLGWRAGWGPAGRNWDPGVARRIAEQAWPHFLSHSGTLLLMRLDQMMLFAISGAEEAGVYAAATRLSELVYAVGPIVMMVSLPRLAAAFETNRAGYRQMSQLLFGVMSCLGLAVAVGCWTCGGWAVRVLYGEAFAGAAPVLWIHCLSALPYLHGQLCTIILVSSGQARFGAWAAYGGLAVNVLLNLWLVPLHGAQGAAWATAASYGAAWLLGMFLMAPVRWLAWQQLRSLAAPLTLPLMFRETRRLMSHAG